MAVGSALGAVGGAIGGAYTGWNVADHLVGKAVLFNDLMKIDITDRHMRPYVGSQQAIDAAEAKDEIILEQATLKAPKIKNHPNLGKAVEGDRVSGEFGLGTVTAIREDGVVTPMDADYSVQAEPGDPVLIVETEDGAIEADNASKIEIVKYATEVGGDPEIFFTKARDDLSLTKSGNPYRDKEGKFTDKESAAFTVGRAAAYGSAGAAAGFGAGVAAGAKAKAKPKRGRGGAKARAPKAKVEPKGSSLRGQAAQKLSSLKGKIDDIYASDGMKGVKAAAKNIADSVKDLAADRIKYVGDALKDPKIARRILSRKGISNISYAAGGLYLAGDMMRGLFNRELKFEIDPVAGEDGKIGAKIKLTNTQTGETVAEVGDEMYLTLPGAGEEGVLADNPHFTAKLKGRDLFQQRNPDVARRERAQATQEATSNRGAATESPVSSAFNPDHNNARDKRFSLNPKFNWGNENSAARREFGVAWQLKAQKEKGSKSYFDDLNTFTSSTAINDDLTDEEKARIIYMASGGNIPKNGGVAQKALEELEYAAFGKPQRVKEPVAFGPLRSLAAYTPTFGDDEAARRKQSLVSRMDNARKAIMEGRYEPSNFQPKFSEFDAAGEERRSEEGRRRNQSMYRQEFVEDSPPPDIADEIKEELPDYEPMEFSAPVDFTKAAQEMADERDLFKLAKSTPPKRGESREEYITRLVSRIS